MSRLFALSGLGGEIRKARTSKPRCTCHQIQKERGDMPTLDDPPTVRHEPGCPLASEPSKS